MPSIDPEEYAELVLRCVEQVPPGRVTTYGTVAEVVGQVLGGGGPRQVGSVMSAHGGPVPWWRVVHADGTPARPDDRVAREHHLAEGTPLRPSGKVDLRLAMWWPDTDAPDQATGMSAPGDGMPG